MKCSRVSKDVTRGRVDMDHSTPPARAARARAHTHTRARARTHVRTHDPPL